MRKHSKPGYRRGVSQTQAPFSSQVDPPETGRFGGWRNLPRRGRGLNLSTLIVLRWLAIIGQSAAILTAYFYLHFPLPLIPVQTTRAFLGISNEMFLRLCSLAPIILIVSIDVTPQ